MTPSVVRAAAEPLREPGRGRLDRRARRRRQGTRVRPRRRDATRASIPVTWARRAEDLGRRRGADHLGRSRRDDGGLRPRPRRGGDGRDVGVPVIAHGGAGKRRDLAEPVARCRAAAVAAGSLFVFQGSAARRPDQLPAAVPDHRADGDWQDQDLRRADHRPAPGSRRRPPCECTRCLYARRHPRHHLRRRTGSATTATSTTRWTRSTPRARTGERALERHGRRAPEGRAGQGVRLHRRRQRRLRLVATWSTRWSSWALRPLAVHFDNTWNSPIATSNIYCVLEELDVAARDATSSTTRSTTTSTGRSCWPACKDVEAPTDIGFMGVLYRAAEKHGIKHIVEGHSFRTEGVSPLGWLYMDGGYIQGVHDRFGTVPMKTYPNMAFRDFVRWSAFSRDPAAAPAVPPRLPTRSRRSSSSPTTYGWQWYGGHHLENRFTAFYHSYLLPQRFGIDMRILGLLRPDPLRADDAGRGPAPADGRAARPATPTSSAS